MLTFLYTIVYYQIHIKLNPRINQHLLQGLHDLEIIHFLSQSKYHLLMDQHYLQIKYLVDHLLLVVLLLLYLHLLLHHPLHHRHHHHHLLLYHHQIHQLMHHQIVYHILMQQVLNLNMNHVVIFHYLLVLNVLINILLYLYKLNQNYHQNVLILKHKELHLLDMVHHQNQVNIFVIYS